MRVCASIFVSLFACLEGANSSMQLLGPWKPDTDFVCVVKRNNKGKTTGSRCLVDKTTAITMVDRSKYGILVEDPRNCQATSKPSMYKLCEVKGLDTDNPRFSQDSKVRYSKDCFNMASRVSINTKIRETGEKSTMPGVKSISDPSQCRSENGVLGEPSFREEEEKDPWEGNSCEVKKLNKICKCSQKSRKGMQCAECFDKYKWGYGCDLHCPDSCAFGCQFNGDCRLATKQSKNCKRNGRADKPGTEVTNKRGECQACEGAFFGLYCEENCPTGCKEGVEGHCTRGGKCYSCAPGFYGATCERKCPTLCPECLMEDAIIDGVLMPAGSCTQKCDGNTWGRECEKPCPKNCAGSTTQKATCLRDTGVCVKCKVGFHGNNCDKTCGHCAGKACKQDTGVCESGCDEGFWGTSCEKTCPKDSKGGCDILTGMPKECINNKFPAVQIPLVSFGVLQGQIPLGSCKDCPVNCLNQECNQNGKCNACKASFWGPECELRCSENCLNGCDQKTAQCLACKPGFTGKMCSHSCHRQCKTCDQFGPKPLIGEAPAGNKETECQSCREDTEPTIFEVQGSSSVCSCKENARRNDEGTCFCVDPENDPARVGYFDAFDQKCRTSCGPGTREVQGCNGRTGCLLYEVYRAIVLAENADGLKPIGSDEYCEAEEHPVEMVFKGRGEMVFCVHKDFAKYIQNDLHCD